MSEESSTFEEVIEGIGAFTFHRRNMRKEIACAVELQRLTEGVQLDGVQKLFVDAMADLKVLIVSGPPGWDADSLDNMDPFDDKTYGRVLKVWSALRGKEETFRKARPKVQAQG